MAKESMQQQRAVWQLQMVLQALALLLQQLTNTRANEVISLSEEQFTWCRCSSCRSGRIRWLLGRGKSTLPCDRAHSQCKTKQQSIVYWCSGSCSGCRFASSARLKETQLS